MNSLNTLRALHELGESNRFGTWFNSGNVAKREDKFFTQCTQYRIAFDMQELQEYFIKEYTERQY